MIDPDQLVVRRLAWQPYRVPFAASFGTAHGALQVREGALVQLLTSNGLVGWGELAPLPAFGGSLLAALAQLAALAPLVVDCPLATLLARADHWLAEQSYSLGARQAVLASLDLAVCDLLAQAAGLPLAAWLGPRPPRTQVPVNATVGAADPVVAVAEAERAATAGFRSIKLKVGTAASVAAEKARIMAVRAALPLAVELRLDANAAWTVAQARAVLQALPPNTIGLVEQPVASLAELAHLRAMLPDLLLAADELVTDPRAAAAIIAARAVDVLVVKPLAVGGLRPARQIIEQAETAGLGVIVTSLLESGVGVTAALHVAATLRPPLRPCGLATTSLLVADLLMTSLVVQDGLIGLPSGPGLGVMINRGELAEYARPEN